MTDRPTPDRPSDADDYFEDQNNPETRPARDIHPDEILPESAMGGAGDSGAHGHHPASSPAIRREGRPARPEEDPGDASIERRHRDLEYRGPDRRISAH